MKKHPDKNNGEDEGFREVKEACNAAFKYISENINDDLVEEKETIVRKEFAEANVVVVNINSETIKRFTVCSIL